MPLVREAVTGVGGVGGTNRRSHGQGVFSKETIYLEGLLQLAVLIILNDA